jgi:glutamine amidotransferase
VRSEKPCKISEHLENFSLICKNSSEYQGHGWGCSYLDQGDWVHYKNINPIWEDNFRPFPQSQLLVAHARSAFQDRDIIIENNMPFFSDNIVFIFNGELHGVRIKENGRIGAEKIFNFILRFYKGSLKEALSKATKIVEKRTRYIRAMNIIMATKENASLFSLFNQDESYFTMYSKLIDGGIIVCSDPYLKESGWTPFNNRTIEDI